MAMPSPNIWLKTAVVIGVSSGGSDPLPDWREADDVL